MDDTAENTEGHRSPLDLSCFAIIMAWSVELGGTPSPPTLEIPQSPHYKGELAGQHKDAQGHYVYAAPMRVDASKLGSVMGAIRYIESRNRYEILGPVCRNGDRAYGAYQVMGNNIAAWTKEALGHSLSKEEFLHDPAAQDAVARYKMSQTLAKYGNVEDVASVWFSGRPVTGNNSHDVTGTSVPQYARAAQEIYQALEEGMKLSAAEPRSKAASLKSGDPAAPSAGAATLAGLGNRVTSYIEGIFSPRTPRDVAALRPDAQGGSPAGAPETTRLAAVKKDSTTFSAA